MKTFFLIAQPIGQDGLAKVEVFQTDTATKARYKADQVSKRWQTTVVVTEYRSRSLAGYEPKP